MPSSPVVRCSPCGEGWNDGVGVSRNRVPVWHIALFLPAIVECESDLSVNNRRFGWLSDSFAFCPDDRRSVITITIGSIENKDGLLQTLQKYCHLSARPHFLTPLDCDNCLVSSLTTENFDKASDPVKSPLAKENGRRSHLCQPSGDSTVVESPNFCSAAVSSDVADTQTVHRDATEHPAGDHHSGRFPHQDCRSPSLQVGFVGPVLRCVPLHLFITISCCCTLCVLPGDICVIFCVFFCVFFCVIFYVFLCVIFFVIFSVFFCVIFCMIFCVSYIVSEVLLFWNGSLGMVPSISQ